MPPLSVNHGEFFFNTNLGIFVFYKSWNFFYTSDYGIFFSTFEGKGSSTFLFYFVYLVEARMRES